MQKKIAILVEAVYQELVNQVRDNLTPDLLKPQFRDAPFPVGHCYVASEAVYHLAGGKDSGLIPYRLRMPDGVVHWWLETPDGEVIDPTHDQFDDVVPYDQGKAGGFLTREPSRRARVLMDRVEGHQSEAVGKIAQIIPVIGLKPHSDYDDGRRTFIYIIPTDHLYLADNNGYHNDIFNYIYSHDPEDTKWLADTEQIALGFIERNYEDHALEARNYWAEGEKLPDSAIHQLENYFGERIYQRDWEYPVDWTQVQDMPDPREEEPTVQWPEGADDQPFMQYSKTAAMREVKWLADQVGGSVEPGGIDEVNGKPLPPYLVMPDGTRVQIGVTLKKNWNGRPAIVLHWIQSDPQGTGAGTRVMELLKQMADAKGYDLQVYMAANSARPFYKKFDWLDNSDDWFPVYKPLKGYEQQRESGVWKMSDVSEWHHPDRPEDYKGDWLHNSTAYALIDGQLYLAPNKLHSKIYSWLQDHGMSYDQMETGLWGYYDPERGTFEHTDMFGRNNEFHTIDIDPYLPTAIDVTKTASIRKHAFDYNFIYTARGQLYIEDRPHPQIMREHHIFRTTKFVPGIILDHGDEATIAFFSWSQDDDAELHEAARQAIQDALGKDVEVATYDELVQLDKTADRARMNERWNEHFEALPYVWLGGKVWIGALGMSHSSIVRDNPELFSSLQDVTHDAPWRPDKTADYYFGRIFPDGEVVDWIDNQVPENVANDVRNHVTPAMWEYDEANEANEAFGKVASIIQHVEFEPTEFGGSREDYAQPVVYDPDDDTVYIGPPSSSHAELLRNLTAEWRDMVDNPIEEQTRPGFGYIYDPRAIRLGYGEINISPITLKMDWDWYTGPEPTETMDNYVHEHNADVPPAVPPLSFETKVADTQPIELMYTSPYEFEEFQQNLRGNLNPHTNDSLYGRLAWIWKDGTLYIGVRHRDIMKAMKREGLDPTEGCAFGWIDPAGDGVPWSMITDYGTQDPKAQEEATQFFNTYGPDAVMNYALTGRSLRPISGWRLASTIKDHTEEFGEAMPSDPDFKFIFDGDTDTLHVWRVEGEDGHPWHRDAFIRLFHLAPNTYKDDTYAWGWGNRQQYGIYDYGDEQLRDRAADAIAEYEPGLRRVSKTTAFTPEIITVDGDAYDQLKSTPYIYLNGKIYLGREGMTHRTLMQNANLGDWHHGAEGSSSGLISASGVAHPYSFFFENDPELDQMVADYLNNSRTAEYPGELAWIYVNGQVFIGNNHGELIRTLRSDWNNRDFDWDDMAAGYIDGDHIITMWNNTPASDQELEQAVNSHLSHKLAYNVEQVEVDSGQKWEDGYPFMVFGDTVYVGEKGATHSGLLTALNKRNLFANPTDAYTYGSIWQGSSSPGYIDFYIKVPDEPEIRALLKPWSEDIVADVDRLGKIAWNENPAYNLPWDNNHWQGGWIYDPKNDQLYTGRFHAGIMRENPQLLNRNDITFGHFTVDGAMPMSYEYHSDSLPDDDQRGVELANQWWREHAPKYRTAKTTVEYRDDPEPGNFIFTYSIPKDHFIIGNHRWFHTRYWQENPCIGGVVNPAHGLTFYNADKRVNQMIADKLSKIIGQPLTISSKTAATIEWLNTGRDDHGMGFPFLYDTRTDTIYLSTRESYHADLLKHLPFPIADYYGQDINDETEVTPVLGGRIDLDNEDDPVMYYDFGNVTPEQRQKVRAAVEQVIATPEFQQLEAERQRSTKVAMNVVDIPDEDSREYGWVDPSILSFYYYEPTDTVYIGSGGIHHADIARWMIEHGIIEDPNELFNGAAQAGLLHMPNGDVEGSWNVLDPDVTTAVHDWWEQNQRTASHDNWGEMPVLNAEDVTSRIAVSDDHLIAIVTPDLQVFTAEGGTTHGMLLSRLAREGHVDLSRDNVLMAFINGDQIGWYNFNNPSEAQVEALLARFPDKNIMPDQNWRQNKTAMPMNPPEELSVRLEQSVGGWADGYWKVMAYIDGNKEIGHLWLEPNLDGTMTISHVWTDPRFQRRGIATLMLQKAEEKFVVLHDWMNMTDEGKGWATGVGDKPSFYMSAERTAGAYQHLHAPKYNDMMNTRGFHGDDRVPFLVDRARSRVLYGAPDSSHGEPARYFGLRDLSDPEFADILPGEWTPTEGITSLTWGSQHFTPEERAEIEQELQSRYVRTSHTPILSPPIKHLSAQVTPITGLMRYPAVLLRNGEVLTGRWGQLHSSFLKRILKEYPPQSIKDIGDVDEGGNETWYGRSAYGPLSPISAYPHQTCPRRVPPDRQREYKNSHSAISGVEDRTPSPNKFADDVSLDQMSLLPDPVKVVYIPTPRKNDFPWRVPVMYDQESNTVYYGDKDGWHRDLLKGILSDSTYQHGAEAVRADPDRWVAGWIDPLGYWEGKPGQVNWFTYFGVNQPKPPPEVDEALQNAVMKESHIAASLNTVTVPTSGMHPWGDIPFIYTPINKTVYVASDTGRHNELISWIKTNAPDVFEKTWMDDIMNDAPVYGELKEGDDEYPGYVSIFDPYLEEGQIDIPDELQAWAKEHFQAPVIIEKTGSALQFRFVPNTDSRLNSSRVPVVYNPIENIVYYGEEGGTHPDLFREAVGEAKHMSQPGILKDKQKNNLLAGVYDPEEPSDLAWMWGDYVDPEAADTKAQIKAYLDQEFGGPRPFVNRLESHISNIIDLTGWDNTPLPLLQRSRAVAFASDGKDIYFGTSHPQIVQQLIPKDHEPTQNHPMFDDANWVFGWADRVGPDDPWRAEIVSGNFWYQNEKNKGYDEKIRRQVLQYLNTGQIESHKIAITWEDFNNRENLSDEDWPQTIGLIYDGVADKVYTNRDFHCAPYHPVMLKRDPEMMKHYIEHPEQFYFGHAGYENGWDWSWDTLEEMQGSPALQPRADELTEQRLSKTATEFTPLSPNAIGSSFFCWAYVGGSYDKLFIDGVSYHSMLIDEYPAIYQALKDDSYPVILGQVTVWDDEKATVQVHSDWLEAEEEYLVEEGLMEPGDMTDKNLMNRERNVGYKAVAAVQEWLRMNGYGDNITVEAQDNSATVGIKDVSTQDRESVRNMLVQSGTIRTIDATPDLYFGDPTATPDDLIWVWIPQLNLIIYAEGDAVHTDLYSWAQEHLRGIPDDAHAGYVMMGDDQELTSNLVEFPPEVQAKIQDIRDHIRRTATTVEQIPEVDPDEIYEATKRKPFVYSPIEDKIYIGPFGAHHHQVIWKAYNVDDPNLSLEKEQIAMSIEDNPGNLGIILDDKHEILYWAEPDNRVVDEMINLYPNYSQRVYDWDDDDFLYNPNPEGPVTMGRLNGTYNT